MMELDGWRFLGELLLLLGGAVALGAALEAIGVSAVIGYLLAGVILGPGLTGLVADVGPFEVVAELGVAQEPAVAAAVDEQVVPRSRWPSQSLAEGARILVIRSRRRGKPGCRNELRRRLRPHTGGTSSKPAKTMRLLLRQSVGEG